MKIVGRDMIIKGHVEMGNGIFTDTDGPVQMWSETFDECGPCTIHVGVGNYLNGRLGTRFYPDRTSVYKTFSMENDLVQCKTLFLLFMLSYFNYQENR